MNRHLHRVIFNAARGMRMVVQETASSTGRAGRKATVSAAALLGVFTALAAQAQIAGDPQAPGAQRPTVLVAPNGVPLVNITTPSAAGVSRNTYQQFDVGANGAILNNSRTNVQSQLGGWVQGNPWLATGSARVILNEVRSANPSQLRGYVEIAGARAEVIIANPAGIQVDGGGFINASRATLTTGVPQFNAAGGLDGFLVRGGAVGIEGAGLDVSKTDYAAILARAVQVNAGIWANELKVVAGANDVSADALQVTAQAAAPGAAAPAFALDVAQLGGMYAGKITLIGTEAGLGVRNAGNIGASAGGLVVHANGQLENLGTLEAPRLELTSTGVLRNSGTLRQTGSAGLAVNAPSLINAGGVIGPEPIQAPSGGVASVGTGGGGASAGSVAPAPATPAGTGAVVGSTGQGDGGSAGAGAAPVAIAPGPGTLQADGGVNNEGGRIYAGGAVALNTPLIDNSRGGTIQVGQLNVAGAQTFNNQGGTLNVSQGFGAQVGTFNNQGGTINAGSLDIVTTAGDLDNTGGTLRSNADAMVQVAGSLLNANGVIGSVGALQANAGGSVTNTAGQLTANQRLVVQGATLDNAGGTIQSSSADVQLKTAGLLSNGAGGTIRSATVLGIEAGTLANAASLRAGRDGQVIVQGVLTNEGSITSAGNTRITAGSLQGSAAAVMGAGVQNDGTVGAGAGDLQVTTAGELAAHGTQLAAGDLALQGASIDLMASKTSAANVRLSALAGNVTTSGAQVITPGVLAIAANAQGAQMLVNQGGTLNAAQLQLQVANLSNTQGGEISQTASQPLDVAVTGAIDNSGGRIVGNADVRLQAASLRNRGGQVQAAGVGTLSAAVVGTLDNSQGGSLGAGGNLALTAGALNNDAGRATAVGAAQIALGGAASNVGGTIAANQQLTLSASSLDNTGGSIGAVQGDLAVQTQGLAGNASGKLLAGGALMLTSSGLDNTAGQVSGASVVIDAGASALNNTGGTIGSSAGTLSIRSGTLNNDAGRLRSAGDLSIDTQGQALSNRQAGSYQGLGDQRQGAGQGGISSAGVLSVRAGALDNTGGFVGSQGDATIAAGGVTNQGGLIASNAALGLDVQGSTFDNRGGQTQAGANLSINANRIDNSGALIRSAGAASLTSASLVNRDTQAASQGIEAAGLTIAAAQVDNTRGAIRSSQDATLSSGGIVDNTAGLISAVGSLSLADPQAASPANKTLAVVNTGGTLVANQDLRIDAARLSSDGTTTAGRDLAIALTQDVTNNVDVSATRNLSYTTTGRFINNAKLKAGEELVVGGAAGIDNNAGAEMSGRDTTVRTGGVLDNRGLIDSVGHTQIDAGTLNNTGTGRIYGDRISIAAGNLNNGPDAAGGPAGSIASRTGDIDLGVSGQVSNSDGALILSGADLYIGGGLDANRLATGRAAQVTNLAATIEATGSLHLAAQQLDNLNRGFSTGEQTTSEARNDLYFASTPSGERFTPEELGQCYKCGADRNDSGAATLPRLEWVPPSDKYPFAAGYQRHPYALPGAGVVYADDDPVWTLFKVTPGDVGALSAALNAYNQDFMARAWRAYTQITVTQRQTVQTVVDDAGTPGRITAGADLWLDIGAGRNVNSQVIAGGTLGGNADSLVNEAEPGTRTVTDSGSWRSDFVEYKPYRVKQGYGGSGTYNDSTTTSIDLSTAAKLPNSAPGSVGKAPDGTGLGHASGNAGGIGAATSAGRPGTVYEVAATSTAASSAVAGAGPSGTGQASSRAPDVVRTSTPNGTIPSASLYRIQGGGSYLVETDPRYATYRQWLSSDYLLNQLGLNPQDTQKRLGDGFYEQKLIREQVAQLTGQRYLQGYSSDEDQYTALMNNGAAFAKQFQLTPGVGLTAAQMAQLTTDIVWLVGQTVQLPDGSTQTVLVPQLYVRVKDGDIQGNGALLAGQNVDLKVKGNLQNIEGATIAGRDALRLDAGSIDVLSGSRLSGKDVDVKSQGDLNVIGASIDAGNSLSAYAKGSINVASTTRSDSGQGAASSISRTHLDQVAGLYVTGGSGNLTVQADKDITLTAVVIANSGSGAVGVAAGNDLKLQTLTESASSSFTGKGSNYSKSSQSTEVGSVVVGNGDVSLTAGHDLSARAAQVGSSEGTALLKASNDVRLEAGRAVSEQESFAQGVSKGLLSKTVTSVYDYVQSDSAIGTSIGGKNVIVRADHDLTTQGANLQSHDSMLLSAGNNLIISKAEESTREAHSQGIQTSANGLGKTLGAASAMAGAFDVAAVLNGKSDKQARSSSEERTTLGTTISAGSVLTYSGANTLVEGSTIVADRDIYMIAKGDLAITSAQGSYSVDNEQSLRQSGLIGKGMQLSLGSIKQDSNSDSDGTTQTGSQVASLGGNVVLMAGGAYHQRGSDVLALSKGDDGLGGNIDIRAKSVMIDESISTRQQRSRSDSTSTVIGGSASAGGISMSSLQSLQDTVQAARQTSDSRLQALGAATAAIQLKDIADTAQALASGGNVGYKIGVNLSHSKSQSDSTESSSHATGSNVAGTGNVSISASGAGEDSNINARGSNIDSGGVTSLKADNQIVLQASQDSAQSHTTSSSSGQSVGVGFAGGSQNGFTIELGASRGKGMQEGSQTVYNNTHVGGNKVILSSGGDAVLRGAVIDADAVKADIGGNLRIESLQNTVVGTGKQSSAGVGLSLCIPPICYGTSTVSGSVSRAKANVDYAEVTEQSGIRAGNGGFDISVKGKTDLVGGAITSTQQAKDEGKNSFYSAGGVSASDIVNHSDYDAKGLSLSGGVNFVAGDQSRTAMAGKSERDQKAAEDARASGGTTGKSVGWGSESGSGSNLTTSGISGIAGNTGMRTGDAQAKLNGPKQVDQLFQDVQGQALITGAVTREVMVHTDAAYRALFKEETKFYKVTCGATPAECLADPTKVKMEPISLEEAKANGSILAVNGILNEAGRAGQLAYQNAPMVKDPTTQSDQKPDSLTLMHIAPATTTTGEILVAGYELLLAPTVGYSNADMTYADVLQGQGNEPTLSLGHSRGTIVQTNALNIAADNGYTNDFLTVMGVGGAVSEEDYRAAAGRVTTQAKASFTYMSNDPVSVIAAGNPGDALASFAEFFRVMSTSNSAHSCYGTGAQGCSTIATPVPGGPKPTDQRPNTVMTFQGGVLLPPQEK